MNTANTFSLENRGILVRIVLGVVILALLGILGGTVAAETLRPSSVGTSQRFGLVMVDYESTNIDSNGNLAGNSNVPIPSENGGKVKLESFEQIQSSVSFVIPQPSWLPEGVEIRGAMVGTGPTSDGQPAPTMVSLVYDLGGSNVTNPNSAMVIYVYSEPVIRGGIAVPESKAQTVSVNNTPAIYVEGTWNDQGQWDDAANVVMLTWADSKFTYIISVEGIGHPIKELIQIANSIK